MNVLVREGERESVCVCVCEKREREREVDEVRKVVVDVLSYNYQVYIVGGKSICCQ